ncbi:MAG: Zn-ribbon domain-containing protein [Methanosarcinaceae archaeon]|nr:Zn-ribbon domain-containing protein [Methanosarcinaceae archaeon]
MPHRCTKCGTLFEDGDPVILKGCSNCGWNKFLYVRKEQPHSENKPRPNPSSSPGPTAKSSASPLAEVVKHIDAALALEASSSDSKIYKIDPKEEQETAPAAEEKRVESVRLINTGTYELNIEALLNRDELVVGYKEEGAYAVHLPSILKNQKKKEKAKKRNFFKK